MTTLLRLNRAEPNLGGVVSYLPQRLKAGREDVTLTLTEDQIDNLLTDTFDDIILNNKPEPVFGDQDMPVNRANEYERRYRTLQTVNGGPVLNMGEQYLDDGEVEKNVQNGIIQDMRAHNEIIDRKRYQGNFAGEAAEVIHEGVYPGAKLWKDMHKIHDEHSVRFKMFSSSMVEQPVNRTVKPTDFNRALLASSSDSIVKKISEQELNNRRDPSRFLPNVVNKVGMSVTDGRVPESKFSFHNPTSFVRASQLTHRGDPDFEFPDGTYNQNRKKLIMAVENYNYLAKLRTDPLQLTNMQAVIAENLTNMRKTRSNKNDNNTTNRDEVIAEHFSEGITQKPTTTNKIVRNVADYKNSISDRKKIIMSEDAQHHNKINPNQRKDNHFNLKNNVDTTLKYDSKTIQRFSMPQGRKERNLYLEKEEESNNQGNTKMGPENIQIAKSINNTRPEIITNNMIGHEDNFNDDEEKYIPLFNKNKIKKHNSINVGENDQFRNGINEAY